MREEGGGKEEGRRRRKGGGEEGGRDGNSVTVAHAQAFTSCGVLEWGVEGGRRGYELERLSRR